MKASATGLVFSLSLTLLCSSAAFSQDQETAKATSTAPIAYVYIQVAKGVNVYSETAAGKLTLIKGSPFAISGQMEGIPGAHLLSVGTTVLHSYQITNGVIGRQLSSVNTATYDSEDCGPTTGNQAMLDHTGKSFYVQLSTPEGGGSICEGLFSVWQSYQVSSSGSFTFLGNSYPNDDWSITTAPVFDSSDKWAYAFTQLAQDGEFGFEPFTRASNGDITQNSAFTEQDPAPDPNLGYFLWPFMAAADPSEHLAVVMFPISNCDESCLPGGTGGNVQLASYTINPKTGGIKSTNTQANAPFVQMSAPISLDMSDDGKFVAIGGHSGFQVFNFNGAALPTQLAPLTRSGVQFDQLAWDKADHLFALSYEAQELYIFNVSKAKGVVEIGEPMIIPGTYGLTGIIVVPK